MTDQLDFGSPDNIDQIEKSREQLCNKYSIETIIILMQSINTLTTVEAMAQYKSLRFNEDYF